MVEWKLYRFEELSVHLLYRIMQLRQEVFEVEQNCAYLDADGKDDKCNHLCGFVNNVLVAYARIVPPGISYTEPSIGRVITSLAVRRTGIGKELMNQAISATLGQFPEHNIRIGAQMYLQRFYEEFGFVREGEPYMEDGIPHIIMLKQNT